MPYSFWVKILAFYEISLSMKETNSNFDRLDFASNNGSYYTYYVEDNGFHGQYFTPHHFKGVGQNMSS